MSKTENVNRLIKIDLWKKFGTKEYPAEWDGLVYGGGKMSQRYWEYFKVIELLNLNSDSVVLDIGGGSPKLGLGFFSSLIQKYAKKVIIMDSNINYNAEIPHNVELIKEDACAETLKKLLTARSDITHISCVSVLEHIEQYIREEIVSAVNDFFQGNAFVATFEYHAKTCFWPHQLTARTTSNTFKLFTNYYLSNVEASPVWCENTYEALMNVELTYHYSPSFLKLKHSLITFFRKNGPKLSQFSKWYPVAVKFERL